MALSFRARLLVALLLLAGLGSLVPLAQFHGAFVSGLRDEMRQGAELAARMASHLLRETPPPGQDDPASLLQRWRELAAAGGVYLRVFNATGSPVLEAWPGDLDEARARELLSLLTPTLAGRDAAEREGLAMAILPLTQPGPFAGGRLVAGALHPDLKDQLRAGASLAWLSAGLAAFLAAGAGLSLAAWLRRRLHAASEVATALGRGDYRRRLPRQGGAELDALAEAINGMAEGVATQIRTITEQKSQLETVLNSMREGVMVLDRQCRVTAINRAMQEICPEARQAVGKRPLEIMLVPELQQACEDMADPGARVAQSRSFTIEPLRDRVYDVTMTRLRANGDGVGHPATPRGEDVLGVLAVFHDVSRLTRLERVRRDFVANVSHELRTPLTSIKGYAETLLLPLEETAPEALDADNEKKARKHFLEVILKHANHMTKMVNDLLHLARLESGERSFELRDADPGEALAQARRECQHLLEEERVEVRDLLPESGVLVHADPTRLAQVFRNLLENAAKYGGASSHASQTSLGDAPVPVVVSCQEQDQHLRFTVTDQGPGIPRADRERIFERFYRVEKHRQKHKSGSSGLGLAIARHIVEKMGGEIWVESPVADGHGSAFHFTVPRWEEPESCPAPEGGGESAAAA